MKRTLLPHVMVSSAIAMLMAVALHAAPVPGAIFTTNVDCNGTNVNIFDSKDDVYLDGGPAHPGAAGLPDGEYYVKVTEPNGALLGTSVGAGDETPVVVVNGEFAQCYQLSIILIKASDQTSGYDTTTNPGGEYKVWVSTVASFDNDSTKTDNFKVKVDVTCPEGETCDPEEQATLEVKKYYDADADGIHDLSEGYIEGWKVNIAGLGDFLTSVTQFVAPGEYTASEYDTVETNWIHTTPTSATVTLANGDTRKIEFGNVCLGSGGGLTLGFWSNKNGQAMMNDGGTLAPELFMLSNLNLRNANGSAFDPTTYAQFRTWILNATATNMAYMLSAQLAAMELNVEAGLVSPNALVYSPELLAYEQAYSVDVTELNSLGFIKISDLMALANADLGVHADTTAAGQWRTYQEALKIALDKGNNNLNFAQAQPCPFSFPVTQ